MRLAFENGVEWCIPPDLASESDTARQIRAFVPYTLVPALLTPVFIPLVGAYPEPLGTRLAIATALAGTFSLVLPLILRLTGSIVWTSNLLALDAFAVLVHSALNVDGLYTPTLAWVALFPMLSLAFAGPRWSIFWAIVCVGTYGGFWAADLAGWRPAHAAPDPGFLKFAALVSLMVLASAFGLFLERAKDKALAALAQSNAELSTARDQAESANRAKSAFLANMSHELRTPMTSILGFADLLESDLRTPESREALETVRRNGELLLAVLNDVLDLSKIEAGHMELNPEPVDPVAAAAIAARLIGRRQRSSESLDFLVDVDALLPERIEVDPLRLQQILGNLLSNAVKFTERGSVSLGVREYRSLREVHFAVTDTGIGMNSEQAKNAIEPFVQAEPGTARRYGGTGLGLSICVRLAEQMGGRIDLESAPGRGSRVSLVLPSPLDSTPRSRRTPSAEIREAAPAQTPDVRLDGCRILLAEDGADNRRLISHRLRREGAEITHARNGREALDTVLAAAEGELAFDVILMDMEMPEVDGYTATSELRAAGWTGPIIALTAHALIGDRERCLAVGCDDYVSKPIDFGALLVLIATYCAAKPSAH